MTATNASESLALAQRAPAGEMATPPAQFFRGFEGAATEPFPEAARKVLAEPPDPRDVEIKPDGIVFLPGVAYRRILTRAFGAGGWSILPRSPARVMGNIVVYHGALVCLGRFVAEAVGECFYRENNPNMSYASCVEGAKTDALSRCCKDLGVATDMWDANWREEWKAKYAISYQSKDRDGKPKTMWKLKSRVSNPHDLMAGAGGVAPSADPLRSPSASQPTESASSPGAAPADAPSSDTPDTGEAASPEALEAIKGQLKRLGWKLGMMRIWFAERFGIETAQIDAVRILGRLTEMQAVTAHLLLSAHGKPLYDVLLADARAKGQAK